MGEVEVGLLLEEGVVGADDGGDGLDVEEEVFVDFGGLRPSCCHVEILVVFRLSPKLSPPYHYPCRVRAA